MLFLTSNLKNSKNHKKSIFNRTNSDNTMKRDLGSTLEMLGFMIGK